VRINPQRLQLNPESPFDRTNGSIVLLFSLRAIYEHFLIRELPHGFWSARASLRISAGSGTFREYNASDENIFDPAIL
jgi:hypothetical protein